VTERNTQLSLCSAGKSTVATSREGAEISGGGPPAALASPPTGYVALEMESVMFNKLAGVFLIVIGFFLAPMLIGIPLMIVGFVMLFKKN
jgi:hypothetical protein